MITSGEVSQLFAAQQQSFALQNSWASQIGISNPALNMGAYGQYNQTGMMRVGPGMPGVGAPPPVMNWGPGGMTQGYGSGNRFAAGAMAGIGAGAMGLGTAFGVASMFGKLGRIAPLIDPIAGAMAGYGAAGVGGAMMGAVPGLALGAAAGVGMHAFMSGGQNQQSMHQQIGQFTHPNALSRTGMGFTRDDSQQIANSIRQLAHVPEMLTSTEELTRLLPMLRKMGNLQGVRDAGEFATKFKDTIQTIQKLSQYLGTTMEDAAKFFDHSRHQGFFSRGDQLKNTINAQTTSAMTGLSMGEVADLQNTGGNMAQQFGARRKTGATGITNITNRLQMAKDLGFVDEETILDATGETGPAGMKMASEKMYGMMLGMTQTPMGRLAAAGMLKKGKDGKFEIDQDLVAQFNKGQLGVDELKRNAGALGHEAKMAFTGARGRELGAQLAGTANLGAFAANLVSRYGEGAGDRYLNMLTGGSEADIELLKNVGGGGSRGVDMENLVKSRLREKDISTKMDPQVMWEKAKRKIYNELGLAGLEQAGADFTDGLARAFENAMDDFTGRRVATVSKEASRALGKALGGNTKELENILSRGMGAQIKTGGGGFFSNLRDSELAQSFRGERTAQGQMDFVQRMMGGASPSDTMRRLDEAGKRGPTQEGLEAQSAYGRIVSQLDKDKDFRNNKDDQQKLDQARQAVYEKIAEPLTRGTTIGVKQAANLMAQGRLDTLNRLLWLHGDGSIEEKMDRATKGGAREDQEGLSLYRAGKSGQARGDATDLATAAIFATQGKYEGLRSQIFPSNTASMETAKMWTSLGQIQEGRKDVYERLRKLNLGAEATATLQSNPRARKVISDIYNNKDSKAGAALAKLVQDEAGDDKSIAERLQAQGYEITEKDIPGLRKALVAVQAGGIQASGIVDELQKLRDAEDTLVLRKKFTDAGVDLTISSKKLTGKTKDAADKLIKTLDTAGTGSRDEAIKAYNDLPGVLAEAYAAVEGITDKKERAEAEKSFGLFGTAFAAGSSFTKKWKGRSTSRAQLSKETGISETELEKIGVGKTVNFGGAGGEAVLEGVRARMMGNAAAASLAPGGSSEMGGNRDTEVVKTLKEIATSSRLQTSVLEALVGQTETGRAALRMLPGTRENARATTNAEVAAGVESGAIT